jgi:hypothetical protein
MTSPDGITWTLRTPTPNRSWHAVAYGNGVFAAVEWTSAESNTLRVMSSSDGIAWTSRTAVGSVAHWWRAVAYGGGRFVAVDAAFGLAMTSTTGETWTQQIAINQYWNGLAYGGAAGSERVVAVGGSLALLAPGESVRLAGRWDDTRYGRQLQVQAQESHGVRSPDQAHRWLERLDGVGRALARRIAGHVGERVVEVLGEAPGEGAPDPLTEVEGVGPALARTIRASFGQAGKGGGSLEDWRYLDGLGLTRYQADAVVGLAKQRGCSPRELLDREPYALCEVRGFGFARTDTVARKAGAPADCPARIEAALRHQVVEACSADTMCTTGQLVRQASDLLGIVDGPILDAIRRMAGRGQLHVERDAAGTRWCHPPELVAAERRIARLLIPGEAGEEEAA